MAFLEVLARPQDGMAEERIHAPAHLAWNDAAAAVTLREFTASVRLEIGGTQRGRAMVAPKALPAISLSSTGFGCCSSKPIGSFSTPSQGLVARSAHHPDHVVEQRPVIALPRRRDAEFLNPVIEQLHLPGAAVHLQSQKKDELLLRKDSRSRSSVSDIANRQKPSGSRVKMSFCDSGCTAVGTGLRESGRTGDRT